MKNLVYRPGASAFTHCLVAVALLTVPGVIAGGAAHAQTAPASVAANRALGTVKSVNGNSMIVTTDAGAAVQVTLADTVRVQQLAPGSTDLKTAQAGTVDAIATGDRVLVSGTAGEAGALTATRVILMKSAAIAQRNQSSQADWNRRGMGGIVTAVDPLTGTLSVSSGKRNITVDTTKATAYRRYAPGSVKFEEAKPGTLADIHPGDQVRARGDKSADGLTVTAEEVVSGAFRNLSGTIASVNAAASTIVIKDLTTKKNETVILGSESDLRALPPEVAARFAPGRVRPGAGAAAAGAPAARPMQGADTGAASAPGAAGGQRPGGGMAGGEGRGPGAGGRSAGADLSQMIPRLPKTTLADFKPGEALMIVASGNSGGPYTAITVLSGVEALLTGPAGSEITLPPWSSGAGGGAEAGGGGGPE
ncbi:MAG: DUF5666 domain-containing protein [Janthinobacterium lividum]